ncbi:uncharacterized protein LOC115479945 [Microcaecilia unicolor]|uniref:Uncharacterized protein LOC115479945 n=1 Tax=Microcaecilia unicolor TaxID=1415580 RepID=A0A6P7Z9E9_9AMPH|nr:uncharacterized protein LOC115479945 [Microcaecilia unicolor]
MWHFDKQRIANATKEAVVPPPCDAVVTPTAPPLYDPTREPQSLYPLGDLASYKEDRRDAGAAAGYKSWKKSHPPKPESRKKRSKKRTIKVNDSDTTSGLSEEGETVHKGSEPHKITSDSDTDKENTANMEVKGSFTMKGQVKLLKDEKVTQEVLEAAMGDQDEVTLKGFRKKDDKREDGVSSKELEKKKYGSDKEMFMQTLMNQLGLELIGKYGWAFWNEIAGTFLTAKVNLPVSPAGPTSLADIETLIDKVEKKGKAAVTVAFTLGRQNSCARSSQGKRYNLPDPEEAAIQRLQMKTNSNINDTIMTLLSNIMARDNPFPEACKMLYEVENECITEAQQLKIEPPTISMAIVQDRKK